METLITVETQVNAPIEKVWDAWSNPEDIKKWNAASDDWHTPHAEVDLRPGGKFKSTMASKDGCTSFDFEGSYMSVIHHEFISYKMADHRDCRIEFKKDGDQTHIKETFVAEKENSPELQKAGWQSILNNFKRYVENI